MTTTVPTPNVLVVIEQDVEAFIAKVVTGVEHAIADVEQALSNTAPLMAAAAAQVSALAPFVESMGAAAGQPEIVAGVAAANVAMQGINNFMQTFAQATTGGGVTASVAKTAIVGAYQAYRQVGATYNSVKAATVAAVTAPAVTPPTVTAG